MYCTMVNTVVLKLTYDINDYDKLTMIRIQTYKYDPKNMVLPSFFTIVIPWYFSTMIYHGTEVYGPRYLLQGIS